MSMKNFFLVALFAALVIVSGCCNRNKPPLGVGSLPTSN